MFRKVKILQARHQYVFKSLSYDRTSTLLYVSELQRCKVDTKYISVRPWIAKMASVKISSMLRLNSQNSSEEWFNGCSEAEFDDLFHQISKTPSWQERIPLWKTYFFCMLDVRDQLQWAIEYETKSLARATKEMQKDAKASILGKKIRLIRIEFEFVQGKELGLHQIQTEFALAKFPRRHYTDCPCSLYSAFSPRHDLTSALMQSIGSVAICQIRSGDQRGRTYTCGLEIVVWILSHYMCADETKKLYIIGSLH